MSEIFRYQYGTVMVQDANGGWRDVHHDLTEEEIAALKKISEKKQSHETVTKDEIDQHIEENPPSNSNDSDSSDSSNDSDSDNSNDSNQSSSNDNNVGCPDGRCDDPSKKCLLEVEMTVLGKKFKYPYPSKEKGERKIPKVFSFKNQTAEKGITIPYTVKGKCQHSQSKCVTAQFSTQQIKVTDKEGGKSESKWTTIEKDKPLSGSITEVKYNFMDQGPIDFTKNGVVFDGGSTDKATSTHNIDKENPKNIFEYIAADITEPKTFKLIKFIWDHSTKLWFSNTIDSFVGNAYKFWVNECALKDTGERVIEKRVQVDFVVLPNYKQDFDFEVGFVFKKKGNSTEFSMPIKGSYSITFGRFTTKLSSPKVETAGFPVVGGFLKHMDYAFQSDSWFSKSRFPVRLDMFPPKIKVKGTVEFQDATDVIGIKRDFKITLAPLFGAQISVNILKIVANAIKMVPSPGIAQLGGILLEAADIFSDISGTSSPDERFTVLQGPKKRNKVRCVAYAYLAGRLDIGGEVSAKSANMFDDDADIMEVEDYGEPGEGTEPAKKSSGWDAEYFISANITIGAHAGAWAEARLYGFGFGAGALAEAVVKLHSKIYLSKNEMVMWFGGVTMTVMGETGKGYDNGENVPKRSISVEYKDPSGVSVSNSGVKYNKGGTTVEKKGGRVSWTGEVMKPGKEKDGIKMTW